jgi:diguanylate cyclase (GGDEF)-like protein
VIAAGLASASRPALRRAGSAWVLPLVCLVALASSAVVTALYDRAESSGGALVPLTEIGREFHALQGVPYDAITAEDARAQRAVVQRMKRSVRRIERLLAQVRTHGLDTHLTEVDAPLHANAAVLERVHALLVRGQQGKADALGPVAGRFQREVDRELGFAAVGYRARASNASTLAMLGSTLTILALTSLFAVFYLRARKAHATAALLARENARLLLASRQEALTDSLTGLSNRRALVRDLEEVHSPRGDAEPSVLALFDLDGFKAYNDTFGHVAGDALLARLAGRLTAAIEGLGTAYRMGGDEFCIIAGAGADGGEAIAALAAEALSEENESFRIGCSYGRVLVPIEAASAEVALGLADQQMYGQKASARTSAPRQISDVLLTLLAEQSAELDAHTSEVGRLARATANALGLAGNDVDRIGLAAELHDVGQTAIPVAILDKPGTLDDDEWRFVRQHTLVGERILRAAPSLAHTADLVRSCHERVDGSGYPDNLAGDEIPLGSRVIAVCDAYDVMVSTRPYRTAMSSDGALAELERCAGTQFDPDVLAAFVTVIRPARRLVPAS